MASGIGMLAEIVAMFCWSEAAFASGWAAGPVRWCVVAQHALFAQQPGTHGFSLAVFVMMHGAADNRTVAVNSATTIATETVTLRIINELIAQLSP